MPEYPLPTDGIIPADIGPHPSADVEHVLNHYQIHGKLNTWVNPVTDLGMPTNGVTDCTAYLAAALATGIEVRVPRGTYVTDALTVPAGGCLTLEQGAVLLHRPGGSVTLVTVAAAGTFRGPGGIDGNAANVTSVSGTPIVYVEEGGTCKGVEVIDAKNYGIRTAESGVTIRRNRVINSGENAIFAQPGASADIEDIVIVDNYVDRVDQGTGIVEGGIKVHKNGAFWVYNARISGNRVKLPSEPSLAPPACIEIRAQGGTVNDNITSGGTLGISFSGARLCSSAGNRVFGASDYGIEFSDSDHITATGNTIDGGSIAGSVGFDSNSGSTNCSFTGNTIVGCLGSTMKVETASANIIITGNSALATTGLCLEITSASRDVTVVGNVFSGTGTALKAVMIDHSDKVTVTGNVFREFTQNSVLIFANTAVSLNNIVITGNVSDGAQTILATQLSGGASIGGSVVAIGNNNQVIRMDFNADIRIQTGAGSPEGSVTAGVGAVYLRSNGGANTTIYVKESGTGNTGWVAK